MKSSCKTQQQQNNILIFQVCPCARTHKHSTYADGKRLEPGWGREHMCIHICLWVRRSEKVWDVRVKWASKTSDLLKGRISQSLTGKAKVCCSWERGNAGMFSTQTHIQLQKKTNKQKTSSHFHNQLMNESSCHTHFPTNCCLCWVQNLGHYIWSDDG